MEKALGGTTFSDSYKNAQFLVWYQLGKPSSNDFWLRMPVDEKGVKPSRIALTKWLRDWKEKAKFLDAEIEQELIDKTVAEKVEMLHRHAETGKEIQQLSLNYLRQHTADITPHAAVRLLQLGIEIERESVGIPEALQKMQKLDDDSLLKEITSILNSSEVTVESLEDEINKK